MSVLRPDFSPRADELDDDAHVREALGRASAWVTAAADGLHHVCEGSRLRRRSCARCRLNAADLEILAAAQLLSR